MGGQFFLQHQKLPRHISSRAGPCPHTAPAPRWWARPAPTSSFTKSSSPRSHSPWHSLAQLARWRSQEVSRPCGQRRGRRSWDPLLPQTPPALLVPPCLHSTAHQLRQHGQAFPQAEEAVDWCRMVVPAKPKRHPGGLGRPHGRAVPSSQWGGTSLWPPPSSAPSTEGMQILQGCFVTSGQGEGETGSSLRRGEGCGWDGCDHLSGTARSHLRGSPSQPQ